MQTSFTSFRSTFLSLTYAAFYGLSSASFLLVGVTCVCGTSLKPEVISSVNLHLGKSKQLFMFRVVCLY